MAATALVPIDSTDYVSLGVMPIEVEHWSGPTVYLRVAATKPAIGTVGRVGHRISADHPWFREHSKTMNPWAGDTREVWAVAHALGEDTTSAKVLVTGAP